MTNADKKQALAHYESYKRSSNTSLYDVYSSFSREKANAWEDCKELMYKKNGHGLRIISANWYMFTAGFKYEEDGKQMFMYITKTKDVAVEVS